MTGEERRGEERRGEERRGQERRGEERRGEERRGEERRGEERRGEERRGEERRGEERRGEERRGEETFVIPEAEVVSPLHGKHGVLSRVWFERLPENSEVVGAKLDQGHHVEVKVSQH